MEKLLKVQVYDRRGEQRQRLAHQQAADHRDPQRLAQNTIMLSRLQAMEHISEAIRNPIDTHTASRRA
ncbi:hypothetical protein L9Z73_12605, partial [Pseudomonas sp. TNT11]